MAKLQNRVVGLGLVSLLAAARLATAAEADRVRFNDDWKFFLGDAPDAQTVPLRVVRGWLADNGQSFGGPATRPANPPTTAPADLPFADTAFDDSNWRSLRLPHDWAIEGPFKQELPGETGKRPYAGVGWYRKAFTLADGDAGRQVFLDFDGAMSHAAVWINGRFAGGWPYGYSSFRVDATPFVRPGRNVIAVRLQNPPQSSRWYPGAGIYRNVWLVKTAPLHVAQWGVSVTTPRVTDAAADVQVRTVLDNAGAAADCTARVELFDADDNGHPTGPVLASTTASTKVAASKGQSLDPTMLTLPNPRRWSPESPHRYVARFTLEQNGKPVDRYDQPFGVRTIEFTADNGFLLNGRRLPLNGVCEHHDLGAFGAAFNTRAMERKLQILKSFGVTALRTSHNPPAPELLDLCDRLGVVVLDESFDCWSRGKLPGDYGGLFDDWSERDLRALIRRDRNHPSVIAWSIGNEVNEQGRPRNSPPGTPPVGIPIGKRLTAIAHDEDPTRLTTAGFNYGDAGFNGMNRTVDVMGFNYKPGIYGRFVKEAGGQPFFSSESSSTVSSRGEYFFPVTADPRGGKSDFQMSSYDLYFPGWATLPDAEFAGQDKNPASAGEFVWTGFDYLGEPTPYNNDVTNLLNFTTPEDKAKAEAELKALGKLKVPSRSSYFGIVDLAGFPKDRFYLYQSHWRPDLPMAHLLPHWNWPERVGQVTPVHLYTSGDEAELFLNGRSLGRKKKEPFTYRLRWDDVTYEPGELKAVVYKNGQPWAEDINKTTGPAARLGLAADRPAIVGDGDDLAFVTLSVLDADGQVVPRTNPLVKFTIDGPGEIVATDNGNAIDPAAFQSPDRRAYNGLALAIVRAKPGATGTITLTATADGLTTATTRIDIRSADATPKP